MTYRFLSSMLLVQWIAAVVSFAAHASASECFFDVVEAFPETNPYGNPLPSDSVERIWFHGGYDHCVSYPDNLDGAYANVVYTVRPLPAGSRGFVQMSHANVTEFFLDGNPLTLYIRQGPGARNLREPAGVVIHVAEDTLEQVTTSGSFYAKVQIEQGFSNLETIYMEGTKTMLDAKFNTSVGQNVSIYSQQLNKEMIANIEDFGQGAFRIFSYDLTIRLKGNLAHLSDSNLAVFVDGDISNSLQVPPGAQLYVTSSCDNVTTTGDASCQVMDDFGLEPLFEFCTDGCHLFYNYSRWPSVVCNDPIYYCDAGPTASPTFIVPTAMPLPSSGASSSRLTMLTLLLLCFGCMSSQTSWWWKEIK